MHTPLICSILSVEAICNDGEILVEYMEQNCFALGSSATETLLLSDVYCPNIQIACMNYCQFSLNYMF